MATQKIFICSKDRLNAPQYLHRVCFSNCIITTVTVGNSQVNNRRLLLAIVMSHPVIIALLCLAIAEVPGIVANITITRCDVGSKAGCSGDTYFWSIGSKINCWFFINIDSSRFGRRLIAIRNSQCNSVLFFFCINSPGIGKC